MRRVRMDFSEGESEVENHFEVEKKKKSIFNPTTFRIVSILSNSFPPI